MNLATLLSRLPTYYSTGKSYLFQSPPGRGKTETVARAPAIISELTGKRIGISILQGPLLTPTDAIGFLIPYKDEATGKRMAEFTKPNWWITDEGKPLEDYDGGIIFVDEEDKMDVDVKKAIGEMAYSGRLGPHRLPPGWVVWFAGNRREDRSGSTKNLDHLINRRSEISISDDLDSWVAWAEQKALNAVGITFVVQNANIVFDAKVPEKQGPWCTPRSIVQAIEHLMAFADPVTGRLPHDTAAKEEVSGFIGHGAMAQLMATIQLEYQLPSLQDILSDPLGTPTPDKADGMMLVAYSLANRATVANIDPITNYVRRMPPDMATLFVRTASNRDPDLLDTPTLDKWCMDNATLMQVVMAKKQKRTKPLVKQ